MRTLLYSIYYGLAAENIGLEARRLVSTLLASKTYS